MRSLGEHTSHQLPRLVASSPSETPSEPRSMNELEYVLEEALRREGPALLVFWKLRGLESFVEQANAFNSEQADAPPLPYWLRPKPPQTTTLSVTMGLLEFIGRGSTQSFETMFLTRDLVEYTAMMRRVDQIEQDPFMRAMPSKIRPHDQLATLAVLEPNGHVIQPQRLRYEGVVFH